MHDTSQEHDILAIRELVADTERLQSDLEGFTGLLTTDVVLVNFGGRRVSGRDNVHYAMKQALQTPLSDVITRNELVDIAFVRPDVALVSLVKHVSDHRQPTSAEPLQERGSLTFVVVKDDGRWLIALAQTTPVK
jgi:uncharacterized protein (TIGR02246 family)